jgi:hypothetical protein
MVLISFSFQRLPVTSWRQVPKATPAKDRRRWARPPASVLTGTGQRREANAFLREHPYRVRLASRILGWPDLHDDAVLREFVDTHPFVAFRPADPSATG